MPKLAEVSAKHTMEQRLRWTLQKLLRRMGLIGKVAPSDEYLLKVAKDYLEYRCVKTVGDDQGQTHTLELAAPNPTLDNDLPF